MPSNTLPVFTGDRDHALSDALGLLAPQRLLERALRADEGETALAGEAAAEPTVTAVHRIAPAAAPSAWRCLD